VFKARKVPDFSHPMQGLNTAAPKNLTKFKPFALNTQTRGSEKEQKIEEIKFK
jgi:hypothetical protein